MAQLETDYSLTKSRDQSPGFLEGVKKEAIQTLVERIDILLPKKLPEYEGSVAQTAEVLRKPTPGITITSELGFLSNCIAIILTASQLERDTQFGRSFVDRIDRRKSFSVVLHPLELGTLYRAFYMLARCVAQTPVAYERSWDRLNQAKREGHVLSALHMLETARKLHILHDRQFEPLIRVLCEEITTHPQYPSVEALQKDFNCEVVNDTVFWQQAYQNLPVVSFPQAESLTHEKRMVVHNQDELRTTTLQRQVRKMHILKTEPEQVIEDMRLLPDKKRELKQDQEKIIQTEITRWRSDLRSLTADIYFEPDEEIKKYLRSAIALLAGHFIDRPDFPADRHISSKAKVLLPGLENGQSNPHYQQQVDQFLEHCMETREPLIIWLLAFRHHGSAQLLERSILKDPDRFVDLLKIIIHQLSKYGLLQPEGEKEIIFRRAFSIDNRLLIERLPTLLEEFLDLSDDYPALSLYSRKFDADLLKQKAAQAFTELALGDEPLAELLTSHNLTALAREAALDRLHLLLPKARANLETQLMLLDIRMGRYNRQLRHSWYGDVPLWPQISRFISTSLRRRKVDTRLSPELLRRSPKQKGLLLFSTRLFDDLDDLPLLIDDFEDNELENFIRSDRNVKEIATELTTIPDAIEEAKAIQADLVYLVFVPTGTYELPVFSEHMFQAAWRVGEEHDNTLWVVALNRAEGEVREQATGIKKAAAFEGEYQPYSLEKTFDFDAAVRYNTSLADENNLSQGRRKGLQKCHHDLLDDLKRAPLYDARAVSRVITDHLEQLELYFKDQRFYDIREEVPEQREDALRYAAHHPEVGLHCRATAQAVKKFLQTFGVKASVVDGDVPYFFDGGMFIAGSATRHEICMCILPSGEVLELDFTPPITAQTPYTVKQYFEPKIPNDYDRFNTKFGARKERGFNRSEFFRFMVGSALVGIVIGNIIHKTTGWSFNVDLSLGKGDAGDSGNDDSKDSLFSPIDFEHLPYDKILALVGLVTVGSVGVFKGYERIARARRRRLSQSGYKTYLEKHFNPTEQIVMESVLYPMKARGVIEDATLRRALRVLQEFEVEAARPLLELVAFLMTSSSELFKTTFERCIAEGNYDKLYDVVAQEAVTFTPQEEQKARWVRRLFMQRHPALEALKQRGEALKKARASGSAVATVSSNDRTYDLFCRSLGIVDLMYELREQLSVDLRNVALLDELSKDPPKDKMAGEFRLKRRASDSGWRAKDRISTYLFHINRSLQQGAVELFTPEEIKRMLEELAKHRM